MNQQVVKYVAFALAGILLFAGSFFTFAVLSGTSLEELAVVGDMFRVQQAEPDEPTDDVETNVKLELEGDMRPSEVVVDRAATPLRAFLLQSPFSSDELAALQAELQAAITANATRQVDLQQRVRDLELREQHLEDRWTELNAIRNALDEREVELVQRDEEIQRDSAAAAEREASTWKDMATVFEDGDPEDLTDKLEAFEPEDAAKILRALPDERARSLLQTLEVESFRRYMDAYRKAGL